MYNDMKIAWLETATIEYLSSIIVDDLFVYNSLSISDGIIRSCNNLKGVYDTWLFHESEGQYADDILLAQYDDSYFSQVEN